MGGWQPIETAPKDGTNILLAVRYGEYTATRVGAWRQSKFGEWNWLQHHTFDPFLGEVTHWQPLPDPPKSATPTSAGHVKN